MNVHEEMRELSAGRSRRRRFRAARVVGQLALIATAYALGLLTGVADTKPAQMLRVWISRADGRVAAAETVEGRVAKAETSKSAVELDELLAQLDLYLRELLNEQGRIASAAKRDRIAYNLLRQRGYPDDSIECERLTARQRRLNGETVQLEACIAKAKRLERRLQAACDAAGALQPAPAASQQLFAEIQTYLAHRRPANRIPYVIPDDRWQGGPELLMKPDQGGEGYR